jgi:hypothetical protein
MNIEWKFQRNLELEKNASSSSGTLLTFQKENHAEDIGK